MSTLGTNLESRERKDHHPMNKNKEIKLNKEGKEKELAKIESL